MKSLISVCALLLGLTGGLCAEIRFGGGATTDLANWTTDSMRFDDTVQSGSSFHWENVVVNTATIDLVDNEFDLEWATTTDYTIGHLFMYAGGSVNLAALDDGIESLIWTADFDSTTFANWSPVIEVTDEGKKTYYRWNHAGNAWNGSGPLNFSDPFPAGDPYQFDLSQMGNATISTRAIWGELNSVTTNGSFGGTRDNNRGPDLQNSEGFVRFGFLQWASAGAGMISPQVGFSTSVDSFEVVVNPDPPTAPTVEAIPATGITAVSAVIGGEVTDIGNDFPGVTIFWGTTDGTTIPGSWDHSVGMGFRHGPFTTEITGLQLDGTYFYRIFAENTGGADWSDTAESFVTPSSVAPTVVTTGGAATGPLSASLGGEVTDTGNEPPSVTIYYGTTDGGTDAGSWDSSIDTGIQSGAFAAEVGELSPDTMYFYRPFAENSAGADWADTGGVVTTNAPEGLEGDLDSTAFAYRYEMDVNPSGQDLDGAGSVNDWFPGTSGGFTIPQTYLDGVAISNAMPGSDPGQIDSISKAGNEVTLGWSLATPSAVEIHASSVLDPSGWALIGSAASTVTTFVDDSAFGEVTYYRLLFPPVGPPEVLFRTDFGGSIQREQLTGGDFTVEVAVRVIGPKAAGDAGIFAIAIDPGGDASSLRVNVDTDEVSLDGDASAVVATGDNGDAFHVYRIAYNIADDFYWVWRDGVLIYGADSAIGISGTNPPFNNNGSIFIGDFTGSISGDWEVDFVRLHAAAVGPVSGP